MDLPHLRSLLFAPGSDERKLAKALSSAADAVVCDLEDAVAPAGKAAPEAIAALGADGPPIVAIVETAMGLRQAFETQSEGVPTVIGTMVDRPVVDRVRRILQEAAAR